MLGRIAYQDFRVFVNDIEMSGTVGGSSSFDTNYTPIFVAGTGIYCQEPSGPSKNPFSFERILFDNDPFTGFLFENLSGYFAFATGHSSGYQTYDFYNGRASSYSIVCSVGEVAKTSVEISNHGNIGNTGGNLNIPDAGSYSGFYIGRAGDLKISGLDDINANRATSIEYTLSIPYVSDEKIGQMFGEDSRRLTGPMTIETRFSIEVEDFRATDLYSHICSETEKNLHFRFEDCDQNTVRAFNAPRSKIKSVSFSAGIGSNLTFELLYQGYVNTTGEALAALNGNAT